MPHHRTVRRHLRANAKTLRTEMTDAEKALWYNLRAHRFHGLAFRRQVPIGKYIVDFVCAQKGLIIEVDGGQHYTDEGLLEDANRDAWLVANRYTVVRYGNNEVLNNMDGVLTDLAERLAIAADPPPVAGAPTSPSRGEEKTEIAVHFPSPLEGEG